ncbi:cytochrome c oxidase subunit II [Halalkaliarchaeum desulfuricum]|nr:hypothetical protein [Halalkaliarchaeum desulfuricum]
MTRDRLLGGLALASLFVAPLVLVYDFAPATVTRTAPAFPLDTILSLKSALFAMALVMGGGTMAYLIYVAIRNSELFSTEATPMVPNWKRETFVAWIIVVAGLVGVAILMSAGTIGAAEEPPEVEQELTVEVTASHPQWSFENEHIGVRRTGELRVPVDTVVNLEITSGDVMHNLAIHEMGVKQHAIPGQETSAWFLTEEPGEYDIVCAELCGEDHSQMTATLIVMEQDEYADYIEELTGESPYDSDGGDDDGD